jgi:chemotaxis protein MotB
MAAVGYGEHKPAAPNNTAEGRAKNRKVVLVIMADDKASRAHDVDPSGKSLDITGSISTPEPSDAPLRPETNDANRAAASAGEDVVTIPAKTSPRPPGG